MKSVLDSLLPRMFNDLYLVLRDRIVTLKNEQFMVKRTWRKGDPYEFRVVWFLGSTASEIIRTADERELLAAVLRCREASKRTRRFANVA